MVGTENEAKVDKAAYKAAFRSAATRTRFCLFLSKTRDTKLELLYTRSIHI